MSNNKIDHEAAKRYAAYIGDMARDHVCDQDDVNLSAAYLDAMTRLDKAEKAGESWKDAYFKLIRAIGSSPNCSKSPVSIAHELMARLDKATKLLREVERIGNANPRATNLIRAFLDERKTQ